MDWVAGVDGCPGGWVVALQDLDSGEVTSAWGATFGEVLALPQKPRVIAVDVPIGLLSHAQPGGRDCDKEARKILGRRGSSVFSAPTRPALDALRAGSIYEEISAANRASSPANIGLSKQSVAIMPKIADVDGVVTPELQDRIFEVHPEVSFSAAGDGQLFPSKKKAAGRAARETTLLRLGYIRSEEWFRKPRPPRSSADDLLDACIACWSARRIVVGEAQRLPDHPGTDERGLRMEIWA
jgi:predicted RNase H-like nuclease